MTARGKSVALLLGLQCLTKVLRAPSGREEPRPSSLAPRTARAPGGGRLGGHLSAPPPGRGSAVAAGGEEEEKGRTAPVGSGRNLGAARAAGPGGAAQLQGFHYSGGLC